MLLPAVIQRRSLDDAEDIGAVLISQLPKAAQPKRGKRRRDPNLIVGLIPVADGAMSDDMAAALTQRAELMEQTLAGQAATSGEPWMKRLSEAPTTDPARQSWLHEVRTVAAYRDRYQVERRTAVGEPRTVAQKVDAARADQATRRARAISERALKAEEGRRQTMAPTGRALT